jgi:hypothetical protein
LAGSAGNYIPQAPREEEAIGNEVAEVIRSQIPKGLADSLSVMGSCISICGAGNRRHMKARVKL